MRKTTSWQRTKGLVALMTLGLATVLAAEASKTIEARHEAMEAIGDAMQGLGAIARNRAPFQVETVHRHATTIADELKKAATLFPPGSDKGEAKTFARPEVWADPEGFDKSMAAAEAAAVALRAITKEESFRPALAELGGTCKSCHQRFRLPMP